MDTDTKDFDTRNTQSNDQACDILSMKEPVIWVSANAGSGKTRALIDRITSLLLHGSRPEKILCLTYTNASAGEMRNRLIQRLGSWVTMCDAELLETIKSLMPNTSIEKSIFERARQLFAQVIDLPHGFKIQTIHSFCESIIRQYPFESNIPQNFRLEENTLPLKNAAWRDVVQHTSCDNAKPEYRAALKHMARVLSDSEFAGLYKNFCYARDVFSDNFANDDITPALAQFFKPKNEEYIEKFHKHSFDVNFDIKSEWFREFNISHLKSLLEVIKEMGGESGAKHITNIQSIIDGVNNCKFSSAFQALGKILLTEKNDYRKLKNFPIKKIRDKYPEITQFLESIQQDYYETAKAISFSESFSKSSAFYILGKLFFEKYTEIKQSKDRLDFDDIITITKNLLTTSSSKDWIRFNLDQQIDHILVDEAQDTTPEQWSIIRILADEFFSSQESDKMQRTLFVVGDEKQSIYSFQGASPKEFHNARNHFKQYAKEYGYKFNAPNLEKSYRSSSAILNVVDSVFHAIKTTEDQDCNTPMKTHHIPGKNHEGRVELWPLSPAPAPAPAPILASESSKNPCWIIPSPDILPKKTHPESILAETIASAISSLIGKKMLRSRNRLIRPGDILVLTRRRKTLWQILPLYLKQYQIPVGDSDRVTLNEAIVVEDCLALMQWVLTPSDDLTLAIVLKSPFGMFDDDELFTMAHPRPQDCSLFQYIKELSGKSEKTTRTLAFLEEMLKVSQEFSPFEFLSHALETKGLWQSFLSHSGQNTHDVLEELMSQALLYAQQQLPTIQGFLHWMQNHSIEIKRAFSPEPKEVRIMTVHGAKGLESPVVILADAHLPSGGGAPSRPVFLAETTPPSIAIWARAKHTHPDVQKEKDKEKRLEKEEHERLLYVSLTRAEELLIICGCKEHTRKTPDDCWWSLVKQGMDNLNLKGVITTPSSPVKDIETGEYLPAHVFETYGFETCGDDISCTKDTIQPADRATALPEWVGVSFEKSPPINNSVDNTRYHDTAPYENKRIRGNLVHLLLEKLPPIRKAGYSDEILLAEATALCLESSPYIPLEDINDIFKEVMRTFNILEENNIFLEKNCLREINLTQVNSRLNSPLRKTADCLLLEANSITILDYKTGLPEQNTNSIPEKFIRQLSFYASMIREIFPKKGYPERKISCGIVWTQIPRIDMIDEGKLHEIKK